MRAVGHVRGSWRDRDFLMEVSRWKSFLVEKFLMEKFPMVKTHCQIWGVPQAERVKDQ